MTLLRGTEAPVCQPVRESPQVCCLPGDKAWDVTERVPQLVISWDCYALLFFHVGTNGMASQNLGRFRQDSKVLRVRQKGVDAEVIFSSSMPVNGKGAGRNRGLMQINTWLCVWCYGQGFGFHGHGTLFDDFNLLGRDRNHLTRKGKGIFGNMLANVVR